MHIKLTNGTPVSYSIGQLLQDNPQTSFPQPTPDSALAEYGVYPVRAAGQPAHDPNTQRVVEIAPVRQRTKNTDGTFRADNPATPEDGAWEWVQAWIVVDLTEEELAAMAVLRQSTVAAQRASAYREESDPLFFKAQRGEATQADWLEKVEEIKARFPE